MCFSVCWVNVKKVRIVDGPGEWTLMDQDKHRFVSSPSHDPAPEVGIHEGRLNYRRASEIVIFMLAYSFFQFVKEFP